MKENLQNKIYMEMKKKILNCEYLPGHMLREEDLSAEYDVSRTPIREAVSRLVQDEFVYIKPKKGIVVAPISIKDINQTYEIRLLFENYAVCEYGCNIDKNKLVECLYELNKLKENGFQQDDAYLLDDKIHATIIGAIDNNYILNTYNNIHSKNVRYRFLSGFNNAKRIKDSTNEHLDIVKACIAEDWQKASEALRMHLLISKKVTFDIFVDSMSTCSLDDETFGIKEKGVV